MQLKIILYKADTQNQLMTAGDTFVSPFSFYFVPMLSINVNGKIFPSDASVIHPDNRSFRYGEGLFETIRLHRGKMPLWNLHWNRLNSSLPQLYFEWPKHFTSSHLQEEVLQLAAKNKCTNAARVRITFFKGEGGLWEQPSSNFNYLVQCWPLEQEKFHMNENGIDLGVFEAGRKVCDAFSNLKSNNYLLYVMAAQYAKQQKWNEAIVLNQYGRICDATIANVFFISQNKVHTPQLTEGCVAGVMRSYLLDQLQLAGIEVHEGAYSVEDLLNANEIFLTNAFYGIRWVKNLGNKNFEFQQSARFFKEYIRPLF
jgi:branched-chain amino acid aminotransferase